jgi:hypothetical protein
VKDRSKAIKKSNEIRLDFIFPHYDFHGWTRTNKRLFGAEIINNEGAGPVLDLIYLCVCARAASDIVLFSSLIIIYRSSF